MFLLFFSNFYHSKWFTKRIFRWFKCSSIVTLGLLKANWRNRDTSQCVDVNECRVSNGGCSQDCVNTRGSFFCACSDRYYLDIDGKSCIGKRKYCLYGYHRIWDEILSLKSFEMQHNAFTHFGHISFWLKTKVSVNIEIQHCRKTCSFRSHARFNFHNYERK